MKLEWDEDKRQKTLLERGLDFADIYLSQMKLQILRIPSWAHLGTMFTQKMLELALLVLRFFEFTSSQPATQSGRANITISSVRGIEQVLESRLVQFADQRRDYGEKRMICYGMLADLVVAFVYTMRSGNVMRIISMRKAHKKERLLYEKTTSQ